MISGHERSSQQTALEPRKTQPHSQPTQLLGYRADQGFIPITLHQQNTHNVGPFGNNLRAGCSLTRNSYGVPQNQVSASRRGILLYLSPLITYNHSTQSFIMHTYNFTVRSTTVTCLTLFWEFTAKLVYSSDLIYQLITLSMHKRT